MKSKKSVNSIVCILVIVFATLSLAFAFTGCSTTKQARSAEEFKAVAESAGCTVEEITPPSYPKATANFQARKDEMNIVFWEFETADNAAEAYDSIVTPSQGNEDEAEGITIDGPNYKKYTVESAEDFSIIDRVDNTLLMATSSVGEKDAVKSLFEKLGY